MQESFQSWDSNFIVFLDNLSVVFVLSVLVALFALVLSYWLVPTDKLLFQDCYQATHQGHSVTSGKSGESVKNEDPSDRLLSQLSHGKRKSIADKLRHQLSEEELAYEKRVESEQLEEIFKLMKNQHEKFSVDSKQDIEEQLKLYGL